MGWVKQANLVWKWIEEGTRPMKPDDVAKHDSAARSHPPDRWVFSACLQGNHDECYGKGVGETKVACSCSCHESASKFDRSIITLHCDRGEHALCMAPGSSSGVIIPCNCKCHKDSTIDVLAGEMIDWEEGAVRLENKKEVEIEKSRSVGSIPQYVALGQRHLEKEQAPSIINGGEERFILPVDLLGLYLPADITDQIEEITICYQRH